MAETVFILIGSNMGDRERNLSAALTRLELMEGLEIIASSAVYVTEAQDMGNDAPTFMNQVIMADYQYTPNELLASLEAIEKQLGRTGKGLKLPRTMDLDILLFGEQAIQSERITVPHRELLNRPFAMIPLLQIVPEIIHPVKKRPLAEFLKKTDQEKVILYKDHVARSV